MFCPSCGAQSEDTAQFCLKCGQPLSALVREQPDRDRRPLLWATLALVAVVVLVGGVLSWFFWFRPSALGVSEVKPETSPSPVPSLTPDAGANDQQPTVVEEVVASTLSPPPSTPTPSTMPAPTLMAVEADTATPPPTPTPPPTSTPPPSPTPTPSATSPPTATPNATPTYASAPQLAALLVDDFSGSSIDTNLWAVDRGDGTLAMSDGLLRMSSSGTRYPYIYSQGSPFPSQDDFEIKARLRYSKVKDCGVGVIVTSYLVPAGVSQEQAAALQQEAESNGIQAGVWQDRANGLQIWFRSGADRKDVAYPGPNTGWIELVIRYTDGRYAMILNGSVVYRSLATVHRPGYIWMGHPADLGSNCQWDTLEVDYIRVKVLP